MFDSIIFLFVFSIIYMCIIEVFTVLFRLTGISEEKARFQVISLLTACGFTTSKSEAITMTRRRRSLAATTILFGYIFSLIIVSVVVNVFIEMSASSVNTFLGIGATFTGVFLMVFVVVKFRRARIRFDSLIDKIYMKFNGNSANRMLIMDILSDKIIANVHLAVLPEPLIGMPLGKSPLKQQYGIQVLVLSRGGKILEHIDGDTQLQVNDDVILFGKENRITELFGR